MSSFTLDKSSLDKEELRPLFNILAFRDFYKNSFEYFMIFIYVDSLIFISTEALMGSF
jgi:hypothetical protein